MTPTEFAALARPILDHACEHGLEKELIPAGWSRTDLDEWCWYIEGRGIKLNKVEPDMIDAFVGRWVPFLARRGWVVGYSGGPYVYMNGPYRNIVHADFTTATASAVRVELRVENKETK